MPFDKEWSALKVILMKLLEMNRLFCDQCTQQRKALVENDVQRLKEIMALMEKSMDRIFHLDERRLYYMEVLSCSTHREILNLSDLFTMYPDVDAEEYQKIVQDIREVRSQIAKLVKVNEGLVQSSIRFVHTMMGALVRLPVKKETKLYGAKGTLTGLRSNSRNLLNQKG